MKKYILCLGILLFFGCRREAQISSQKELTTERAKALVRNLIYVKDPETSLCFAICGLNSYSTVLATVPCESVVEVIVK